MIRETFNTFLTNTKTLEILFVLEGVKKAARMSVLDNDLPAVERFCKKHDLALLKSDFKVSMEFEGCYSTRGVKIDPGSRRLGHFFVYLSKNMDCAEKAKNYEEKNDYKAFGELLGYPECCINFFVKNKPLESKKKNDYVIPAIMNSSGFRFPFQNNIFGRYFDTILVSHSPCCFSCIRTRELADRYLKVIMKYDESYANKITDFLKSASLYTNQGVLLLKGYARGEDYFYSSIHSSEKGILYKILNENKRFRIIDSDKIDIGGQEVESWALFFE